MRKEELFDAFEKEAKKYEEESYFEFEVYKEDDKDMLLLHTDLPLMVDMPFQDDDELEEILEYLMTLIKGFDFSYTLEFYNIDGLKLFIK